MTVQPVDYDDIQGLVRFGYPRLKQQLVGQFERDAGAEVVSFEYKRQLTFYLPGERLVIWRGLVRPGEMGFFSNAYGILSEQNMR